MSDERALSVSDAVHPVSLEARVEPTAELLRAPASGLPCVYWRLRVVEHLTARSELVHDLASPDAFELAWGNSDGRRPPVRIRLEPDSARIEATPSLHRAGTPGAVAVARAFGFRADITVEEVLIRPGEEVTADGCPAGPGLRRRAVPRPRARRNRWRWPRRPCACKRARWRPRC